MPAYKLVVMSNPLPGREAEFAQWYQEVHLPEMVALEGFVSARRYRHERTLGDRDAWSHLAIYEIETDDIDRVMNGLMTVAEGGQLAMSEAIDRANSYAVVYEASDPVVTPA